MVDRFLSDAQIAQLHGLMRTGFNTVQAFQDPVPMVQFRRMSDVTGRFENVGSPVQLISITFGLREKSMTNQMVPLQDVRSDGDLKIWADDFVPEVGDRISLDDRTMQITAVYPVRFGVIRAEVRLSQ